jgi:hypothetical protein
MNERTHDVDEANAGPLEAALQGDGREDQGDPTRSNIQHQDSAGGSNIKDSGSAGGERIGSGAAATAGRGSFTTPGAVSSVQGVASKAETFSDPIAGEAQSGAETLEEAKRRM